MKNYNEIMNAKEKDKEIEAQIIKVWTIRYSSFQDVEIEIERQMMLH